MSCGDQHESSLVIASENGGTVLRSEVFNMFTVDLRSETSTALQPVEALLSTEQPILLLSECVFPYMPPDTCRAVLRWFSERYARVSIISYDMFGLGDAFGQVMRGNLQVRKEVRLGGLS